MHFATDPLASLLSTLSLSFTGIGREPVFAPAAFTHRCDRPLAKQRAKGASDRLLVYFEATAAVDV